MLKFTIPPIEQYDYNKQEFVISKEHTLQLEHSLVSLSKWESKWLKPFLTNKDKTFEESIDYIRCMTITQNVKSEVYELITHENIKQITDYIELPMTATIIFDEKKTINRNVVTAEIIYHWMIAMNIPFECQKWHLNRLLTLIDVCNIKNSPPKKRSKREIMSNNTELNKTRRESLNTKG